MKVAVVHGQAHKGSTYHLTQMLLDELDCNKEDVREFNINGIGQCVECYNCILKDESLCPHRAQMAPIIEAIDQADVIIINTPNYCMGMTGQLKSFFDHMAYRWMSHRPNGNMKNKIGVAISTTAGMGASKATKDIRNQLFWWAVGKTYQIPFAVSAFSWDQIANKKKMKLTRKVKNLGWKINQKVGYVRPGVKLRLFFQMMKKMQKGLVWNIVDHDYWEKQGWI